MRNKCRYLGALSMFFLLFACSGKLELDELDPVDMNSTQILIPAPGSTLIDSVKAAFVNALLTAGHEYAYAMVEAHFFFDVDSNMSAVVASTTNTAPIIVFINPKLIKEYTWYGYLLIALHEWYHISICPNSTNDKGHEQMVYDTQYHRWLMKTFGCSANDAKWLSYVGTENTIVYERLSDSEKEKVAACAEKYNIKHKKKN